MNQKMWQFPLHWKKRLDRRGERSNATHYLIFPGLPNKRASVCSHCSSAHDFLFAQLLPDLLLIYLFYFAIKWIAQQKRIIFNKNTFLSKSLFATSTEMKRDFGINTRPPQNVIKNFGNEQIIRKNCVCFIQCDQLKC